MRTRKFKLSHSLLGTAALVALEGVIAGYVAMPLGAAEALVLLAACVGALGNIYVATEVVEEVKETRQMLFLLSAVVMEFVTFFAFQYWFLLLLEPASFPTLSAMPVGLVLHSLMVFVFNPLHLPATVSGQALLIINTLGSLGLAMFILQNIWQIRRTPRG